VADFVTIKYSASGVPLWTNLYNGPGNSYDSAVAVAVDGNGNVVVTGNSGEGGPVYRGRLRDHQVFCAGVALWTNRFNGPANDEDSARALAVDGNGNVVVTGNSAVGVVGGVLWNCATVAYSAVGVPLWTNLYNGGNGGSTANALAVDGNGNVVVTGSSDVDYLTIMYSAAGVAVVDQSLQRPWERTGLCNRGGCGSKWQRVATGTSVGGGGNSDYLTIKYSSAGAPLWTNRYNGPGNGYDYAAAVAVDANGNVFVTGGEIPITRRWRFRARACRCGPIATTAR
jgi:hypothetical protein